jgi:hypothetical protein
MLGRWIVLAKLGLWWVAARGPAGRRWLQWLLTVAAVTGVGALLLPVLRRNPEGVHSYFADAPTWQRVLVLFVASSSAAWILFKLLSPRLSHLRPAVWRRHPPIWSAWAAAVAILCAIDLTSGLGPSGFQPAIWEWALYGGGSVLLVALCRHFTRAPQRPAVAPAPSAVTSVEEVVSDWVTLERWLRSERPAEDDFIGNRRIARRLAGYLTTHGGTVGLVGPFGSGKTSTVAWLKEEVKLVRQPGQPEVWFAEQSCWGFEDSGSAVQQVLARAMEADGRGADCFSLRSLPEAYRKTFSAGGDWLRTLADLVVGSTDPLEQFRHLSEVLESVNSRLVLVIEDLDRTTSTRFDRQEVLALLQRLRASSERISFVLATGQTSARDIDFAKLCDHIEILQEFDAAQVSTLIEAVRCRCLNGFPHIGTAGDENPWNRTRYMLLSRFDRVPLPDAAARLLRTPRALKHTLRRTYLAWQVLHGEVDFDHLLAVNVLRNGAPEAFDFLLRYWDRLHDDPRTWQTERDQVGRIRERLTREWQRVTRDVEWDVRAGMAILVYLLPPASEYLGEREGTDRGRLQGIGHHRYWLRVVNEEIDPGQARDQTILRDIADWRASRRAASPLMAGLCASEDYVGVWEHFAPESFGHDPNLVLVLAEQLLEHFRTPGGARVPGTERPADSAGPVFPEAAFLAMWRFANRYIHRDEASRNWLERQVRLAMPSSLALVNDLYYYWASAPHGVIRLEDRAHIRRVIHELAREQLRSGEDLLRVSHPELVYGVYQLVFPPDSGDEPSECRGLPHWDWLGPVVLDALRANPARFARDVGHLISNSRRGEHPGIEIYEVDRGLLTGFFGEAAGEVIDLIGSARENFTGRDREFLEQLVRSAGAAREPDAA